MSTILEPTDVVCRVHRLEAVHDGEFWGGAEPYLWVAHFKVDGASVAARLRLGGAGLVELSLEGESTVFSPDEGSHGNVLSGGSIVDGQIVDVPAAVGEHATELVPIPLVIEVASWLEGVVDFVVLQLADVVSGLDSDALCPPLPDDAGALLGDVAAEFVTDTLGGIPGVFGGIYVLMEEDLLTDQVAEAGRKALRDGLKAELDDKVLPSIGLDQPEPPDDLMKEVEKTIAAAVEGSVMGAIPWWELPLSALDPDDKLGTVRKMRTHMQIALGDEEDFIETLEAGQHGEWKLRGRIGAAD